MHAQSYGFSSQSVQGARTKKRAKARFVPSEEQVAIAAGCVVGFMRNCRGVHCTEVALSDRVLANNLLAKAKIHRASRLGRDRHEIVTTVVAGLAKLRREGRLRWETDSTGRCMLVLKNWHGGRKHKDKYNHKNWRRSSRVA